MSMNEDRFAGTGKNLGVEQGFGRATGDELEGKIKQSPDLLGTGSCKPPPTRMGKRKSPPAMRQGRCRNTLRRGKSFCATPLKVGRIPRWLSRSASVGLSAVWADIRTIGSVRPLPELARWAWMAG